MLHRQENTDQEAGEIEDKAQDKRLAKFDLFPHKEENEDRFNEEDRHLCEETEDAHPHIFPNDAVIGKDRLCEQVDDQNTKQETFVGNILVFEGHVEISQQEFNDQGQSQRKKRKAWALLFYAEGVFPLQGDKVVRRELLLFKNVTFARCSV